MLYTTILRGSLFSYTELYHNIAFIFSADRLTAEEKDTIFNRVVNEVNNNLPEDMLWNPYTSEITGKVDSSITEPEFNEYLEKAFNIVLEDFEK